MRIAKFLPGLLILMCASASPALAQQKVFEWQKGTYESVRLDPANYHTGKDYEAVGGTIHVDIDAQQPVTIFMTGQGDWSRAFQNPETLSSIRTICLLEHVIKTTYTCDLPLEPMVLIVRDERDSPEGKAVTRLGAVLKTAEAVLNKVDPQVDDAVGVVDAGVTSILDRNKQDASPRQFVAPNDVNIQYYRWICIQNCYPPISVDSAGERKIPVDLVPPGLWRLRPGP